MAACRDHPVDWWFVEGGVTTESLVIIERAKAVCAACPVDLECLAHAVTRPETIGLWGGYTPKRLRAIRKNTLEPRDWRIAPPAVAPRPAAGEDHLEVQHDDDEAADEVDAADAA